MSEKREKRRSRRLRGEPPEVVVVPTKNKQIPEVAVPFSYGDFGQHPHASCFAWHPRDLAPENPDGQRILAELADKHGEKEPEEDDDDLDAMMLRPVMAKEFEQLVRKQAGVVPNFSFNGSK
jgi:hypothetical protein